MYVLAISYEVLVPLSTAILIIINEPPGMVRLSVRLPTQSYRNDVMLHIYTLHRERGDVQYRDLSKEPFQLRLSMPRI